MQKQENETRDISGTRKVELIITDHSLPGETISSYRIIPRRPVCILFGQPAEQIIYVLKF